MKKLGIVQNPMLLALIEYKGWQKNCRWYRGSDGHMIKVLNSLVESGYAKNQDGFYYAIKGVDGKNLNNEQQELIMNALNGVRP